MNSSKDVTTVLEIVNTIFKRPITILEYMQTINNEIHQNRVERAIINNAFSHEELERRYFKRLFDIVANTYTDKQAFITAITKEAEEIRWTIAESDSLRSNISYAAYLLCLLLTSSVTHDDGWDTSFKEMFQLNDFSNILDTDDERFGVRAFVCIMVLNKLVYTANYSVDQMKDFMDDYGCHPLIKQLANTSSKEYQRILNGDFYKKENSCNE